MDTEPRNLTARSVGAGTGSAADVTFQWPPPLQDEGTEPLHADATLAAEPGPHAAPQLAPGIVPRVPDPADAPYLELQEALRKRHTDAESTAQSDHPGGIGVERPESTHHASPWLDSHRYALPPAPRVPMAPPLRQTQTAVVRTARLNQPSRRRLQHSALTDRAGAWLRSQLSGVRSHASDAAFALRALVPLRHRPTAAVRPGRIKQPAGRQLEPPAVMDPPAGWRQSLRFWMVFSFVTLVATAEGIYILWPGSLRTTETAAVVVETPVAPARKLEAAAQPGSPAEKKVGTAGAALSGRLSVRSDPSGADVSIDGRRYGKTPLTLHAVTPGERRIVLKLDGREVRQTVQVEPGGTASVIAPMSNATSSPSSASGWIAIASKADLDIFEGGVLVGSTRSPQVMMAAGMHEVRLVSETLGYEGTQQIRVEPGKVARIGLTLPDSTINLNALPWAEVWIDGRSVGETPIGNLPLGIGTHQIVFRHPELGEKTVSTVVRADVPARVTVDLRK